MAKRTSAAGSTFSYAHQIKLGPADDWFDPKLHMDTELFVDPFLMFDETEPPWDTVHDRLIEFFNGAMLHVADSNGDRSSAAWRRAAAMFSFPEPAEFCLGYGSKTIFGSGSGRGLGNTMLEAALASIEIGSLNISEFGELLLFGEGFGADRISDMVCNIIKDDLVEYTNSVTSRHGVETVARSLSHVGYDFGSARWRRKKVELALNPCWDPQPGVILVPHRFLDELPGLDDGTFWDWVYSNRNEQLRDDIGYSITQGLDRREVIALAKRRGLLRRKYGIQYVADRRAAHPQPYDHENDPAFKTTALNAGQQIAIQLELAPPSDPAAFCDFVDGLVSHFKWMIEDRGLWRALWSGQNARNEVDAQHIFHAAVLLSCKDRDIDLSPEANAGQGPVDFKFSNGWARRSLVELKFAKSSSFWSNLERQPAAYMAGEGIDCGIILVIQHKDRDLEPAFVARVEKIVAKVSTEQNLIYRVVFVDGRPRRSASKLQR